MDKKQPWTDVLYAGLRELAETAFPKTCSTCKRSYKTLEDYLTETRKVGKDYSGLKASWDEGDLPIVELFRNCVCGSTLLEFFEDRRDLTEAGQIRRQGFGELLMYLTASGLNPQTAREELIKVLQGKQSSLFQNMSPPAD